MQTTGYLHLAFDTTVNWRTERGFSPINLDIMLEYQPANICSSIEAIRAACIEHINHLFYWNRNELFFTRTDSKLVLTQGLCIHKLTRNLPDVSAINRITIEIPVSQEVLRFTGISKDGLSYEAEVLALTQAQSPAGADDIQILHAELDVLKTQFIAEWNDLTLKDIIGTFGDGKRQGATAFDRNLEICSDSSDFGISYGSIIVFKFESKMSHSTQQVLVNDFQAHEARLDLCWLILYTCSLGLIGGLSYWFMIWMFRLHTGWYPKRSIGGFCHRWITAVLRDDIRSSAKDSMDIASCCLYSENDIMRRSLAMFPMILISIVLMPLCMMIGPIICSILGNIVETVVLTIIVGPIMGFGLMNSMNLPAV